MEWLMFKGTKSKEDNYIEKLSNLVYPKGERPKKIEPNMTSEEASEVMSERFIEKIKDQLEKSKKQLELTK
ncbi:hypothetical protein [Algoriphagus confluentis]|uniref:Uncharacterized protein n=1 Tax=Algoriphagus confluentis TaxID=1697556 RepID=A0ABQ6PV36_9BACT|nr:hypothetical protein Aconfl_37630 [Algoriphagus confluentis]